MDGTETVGMAGMSDVLASSRSRISSMDDCRPTRDKFDGRLPPHTKTARTREQRQAQIHTGAGTGASFS